MALLSKSTCTVTVGRDNSPLAKAILFMLLLNIKYFGVNPVDGQLFQFQNTQNSFSFGNNEINSNKNADAIKFYLFRNTENEDEKHEIIFDDDKSIKEAGYNKSMPLILLIHGVLSNHLTISDVQQVKNAYLADKYPANIIMVDYGQLTISNLPFIFSPLSIVTLLMTHLNTEVISKRIADLLWFLIQSETLTGPENVHIVGFSLGAHIAGTVGRHLKEKSGRKIRRISGLDPSPQIPLRTLKLDETDADFVDVTLTSLGFIANLFRLGHVQFYINGGGPHQPNCPNFAPFTETYCSHTTAVFYFAKGIKRKNILACECGFTCTKQPKECLEKTIYGQYVPETQRGKFYVPLY